MQSVLIVEPSETLRLELERALKKQYQVYSCANGPDGQTLLKCHSPNGLIINLFLPGTDGLSFLEAMEEPRPQAIITLSSVYPPYVAQALNDLGVNHMLLIPCTLHSIVGRINSILQHPNLSIPADVQNRTACHLRRMGAPSWRGFYVLRVSIPLFAQDRSQSMTKDLYPAAALLCNCDNWQQAEKAARDLIHYMWEQRSHTHWREYFPDSARCPKSKDFISRLADFLDI